jgi:hypothetical protein
MISAFHFSDSTIPAGDVLADESLHAEKPSILRKIGFNSPLMIAQVGLEIIHHSYMVHPLQRPENAIGRTNDVILFLRNADVSLFLSHTFCSRHDDLWLRA